MVNPAAPLSCCEPDRQMILPIEQSDGPRFVQLFHVYLIRSLRAFAITETELKLIAAAATMGLSNTPKNG